MEIREHITKLIEARATAWEAAKAILDGAEGRDLTADEETSYRAINADLDVKDEEIRGLDARAKRTAEIENIRSGYGAVILGENRSADEAQDKLNAELRRFLKGEARELEFTTPKRMSPAQFRKMVAGGEEFRTTLVKGTANVGGNTVQTTFVHQLYSYLVAASAIMVGNATVIETSTGENMDFPYVSARSSAAITAEAAQGNYSNPTFATPLRLSAYKYSVLRQISRELVEDTSVDLLGFLAEDAGVALGLKTGSDFIKGNGSSKPNGITVAAAAGVTGATGVTGAFTADNLIDLFYSIIAPYRANASWVLLDQSMATVRKFKSTTNEYLFQPSLTAGAPDTLLGKPILTDASMPATGLGAASVVFGDLSKYYVRLVNGVRFEQSTDFAFDTDLVTYKSVLRADGNLLDANAVKTFVGGAS